jgi:hypothetical protein
MKILYYYYYYWFIATQSSHFWLMEGVLECYVQEKPSGEENLQALVSLLFDAGTANCIHE